MTTEQRMTVEDRRPAVARRGADDVTSPKDPTGREGAGGAAPVVGCVVRDAPEAGARRLGRVTREAFGPGAWVLGCVVRQAPDRARRVLGRVTTEASGPRVPRIRARG
jgi:hypothetical protein